ncbi:uncharacterized protein EAF02_003507 [Botrytis sinoallii]|uniref:uncharacterized protein n=1 Tax=Botrytis sinoallii TaxID=1463999 RepID=UPI00190112B9|nr:uncharacterized protein EAF02_003507 [Botrytis sinoallii]KAF7886860.1 hypothetical protein EAF02_003507 [Botrytis sinoallii]
MERHSSINSFGKRDNDDPPRKEPRMLKSQREMFADYQDSRRDSDSYASKHFGSTPRREVDSYRPSHRTHNPYFPRASYRNHAVHHPSRLGPGTRETTTQGSENTRFDTARTSLSGVAGSANATEEWESAPLVSHPAEVVASPEREEAPPSRAEDEYELLSEHAGGPIRRFTKLMCDVITKTITENSGNNYLSAIEILSRACNNVAVKTGTFLEVHDCWLYWRKKGMQRDIAPRWPENLDEVDKEVERYRQLKTTKSESTKAAYVARLATAPVTSESSVTPVTTETVAAPGPARKSKHWTQKEKNFLFEMVKARVNKEYRVKSMKYWWSMVGVAMRKEGYTRKSDEYREWFEQHGRKHFSYHETGYYSQPGDLRVHAGRMQHGNGIMTPEDSPVDDAPRKRRGDSQLNSSRVRFKVSLAQKSPRIPKTPKANKPRMASMVAHDNKSWAGGYRVKDKTAKRAEEYPLQLITPSTGERFEPFTTEPRAAYAPPPSPAASPPGSPLFVTEDEPQIEPQNERDSVPSARNSTTSRFSTTPALADYQSMMSDETTTPEEALKPDETMTSNEGVYSGEPTTADERIDFQETMSEEVDDTPSLQPNETEDAENSVQWIGDEWGFATPPAMRPSGTDGMTQMDNHETPLSQPVSTSDIESENSHGSKPEEQLLREQQERTDLEIANLRANYLRVKEAREDDMKKLDDTAEELDIMILRRAEQLESQAANLAEMQRIEAELEEKIKVKQALSGALEETGVLWRGWRVKGFQLSRLKSDDQTKY